MENDAKTPKPGYENRHSLFIELLRAIEARFEPADELERSLVASIAVARWRQYRNWERGRDGARPGASKL